jgi:predicted porin
MQKKLIAAAVAGLLSVPAFAQSNVTISGLVKAGWESYKITSCTTGFSCNNESRVSDQSSRIIFNVLEDLGGGLKAWAQIDSRYANDLGGGAIGSGNTGVGFMGNWGKFTIGRWDVHYGEFGAIESNRAGSLQTYAAPGIMSQVSGRAAAAIALTTVANGTRTPNILMWDSPNWNGFTARLAYTTSYAAGEGTGVGVSGRGNPGGGSAWTGALRYNNGPWTAGVSYWNADSESRVFSTRLNDQRSWRAWVGYTFAMGLKLGFGWDRSSVDNHFQGYASTVGAGTARRHAWFVPVSYSFGPHAVYGTYARAGHASGSNIAPSTGGDYKAHQWTIGYDYAFSKRTSAGVFYTKLNNHRNAANTAGGAYDMFGLGANGATATARGEGARQIYIGMAHSF